MAHCDLNMLINAAFTCYRISSDKEMQQTEQRDAILKAGFEIHQIRMATKNADNTYSNKVTAVCYSPPKDEPGPIIIAYRGTNDKKDIAADAHIAATGVADKQYRDEAYAFYQEMKEQHPGREIILTGHSLGGNLAQYVGARSYSESLEKGEQPPSLLVRTFNSAPVNTRYGDIFKTEAGAPYEQNFVNYRLEYDIVSKASLAKSCYGNMYTFLMKDSKQEDQGQIKSFLQKSRDMIFSLGQTITAPFKKAAEAHFLRTMTKHLPDYVKTQTIGTTSDKKASQSALEEMIKCSLSAYEVRIAGQYFSGLRQGSVNLAKIKEQENKILKAVENQSFHEAVALLGLLASYVSGKKSNELIQTLISHVIDHNVRVYNESFMPAPHRAPIERSQSFNKTHSGTSLFNNAHRNLSQDQRVQRRNSIS